MNAWCVEKNPTDTPEVQELGGWLCKAGHPFLGGTFRPHAVSFIC